MKSTATENFLDKNRPLQTMLRDQIAMQISCPTFERPRRNFHTQEEYDAYALAEWRERYRLADLIIKECRKC